MDVDRKNNSNTLRMLVVTLLVLLVVAIAFVWNELFLESLHGETDLTLSKDDEVVNLFWDEKGVVHVNAKSEAAAYFAMGYAHAQDRLWQLELQRRTVRGTLAELLGKNAINSDIWMRTLGIYESAEKSQSSLPKEAIDSLQAYSDGINHWINQNNSYPFEFKALGVKPGQWTPVDSLAWTKYFALALSTNYRDELKHFIASQYLRKDQFSDLFPEVRINDGLAMGNVKIDPHFYKTYLSDNSIFQNARTNSVAGSNAWVVAGTKTSTGAPILANDPHLGFQIPSLWYAATIATDNFNTSGMSIVGLPLIVFGRNEHIAWGGTSMMADVQDLYFESEVSNEPGYYLYDGEKLPYQVEKQLISVKPDFPSSLRSPLKPLEILVRKSINGPVISDVLKGTDRTLSLKWTGLDTSDTTYQAFWLINKARNKSEFLDAAEFLVAPALNLFYADYCGNIGLVAAGKIPVRKTGNGSFPVAGGASDNEWVSYIPFKDMPKVWNPSSGYLVNANNKNTPSDSSLLIASKFDSGNRANRIKTLIDSTPDNTISVEITKQFQRDVIDDSVKKLLVIMKDRIGLLEDDRDIANYLVEWDGSADGKSVGATIYYSWLRHIKAGIFEDNFRAYWNHSEQAEFLESVLAGISGDKVASTIDSDNGWCDDVRTLDEESCDQIVKNAYEEMLTELVRFRGGNPDHWKWEDLQHAFYSHKPFGSVRLLQPLFEKKYESQGSSNTIDVAGSYFDKTDGYVQVFGAGFRQIIQLDEGAVKHFVSMPLGQSGQALSKNFTDLAKDYHNGIYFGLGEGDPKENNVPPAKCDTEFKGNASGNI